MVEGISGQKEIVGEPEAATPIEPSISLEELFGFTDQAPDISTYEDMIGDGTDASSLSNNNLARIIYDDFERKRTLSPQDTALANARTQAAARNMERYERLAAQDSARMDSLRARQARFDEMEQGYQDELVADRAERQAARKADQISELARIVGGSISRGRFQEGGIGGGISEGITDLRDLQERQRAEDRVLRDQIRDIDLRRFEAESTAEERLLQIERDIISGRITAEQGADEAALVNAQRAAEISRAELDTTALVNAAQIASNENISRAEIAAEMHLNERSMQMTDPETFAHIERLEPQATAAIGTVDNVRDLASAIKNNVGPYMDGFPPARQRRIVEGLIRKAMQTALTEGSEALKADIRRLYASGTADTPGAADGGFMEQGLGTLIPRP